MTPIWLLDVDGVLNASRAGWSGPPRTGRAVADGHSYTIRWAPELVARITAVHEAGLVEVRWATTWVPWVDALAGLLGLPDFPTAWDPASGDVRHDDPSDVLYAKQDAAMSVVADGRRLVWTDDDAIPFAGPVRDALDAAGALLIEPGPRGGLRSMHMDAIEAFAIAPSTAPSTREDATA